jgi:hypothetical protein
MTKRILVISASLSLTAAISAGLTATVLNNRRGVDLRPVPDFFTGSLGTALLELAGQRFSEDQARGETWIWTIHDRLRNPEFLEYSDGHHHVLSIPTEKDQIDGFYVYVSAYNGRDLELAGEWVKAGRFEDAKKLYMEILHFDACGDQIEAIEHRLRSLEIVRTNWGAFREPDFLEGLVPPTLPAAQPAVVTIVTNLLSVPVEKLRFAEGERLKGSNAASHAP